jgi:hypothetical protein
MPDGLNDLIKKSQPQIQLDPLQNAPGISPVAPGTAPTGVVKPPVRRIAQKPVQKAPNPYQTAFQKAQNDYNSQLQGFETWKKLQNPDTSGDLTKNFINKGSTPEVTTWFDETYKSDPEFAKIMDTFHSNLLALQHNLPMDVDQANESKTASQKIIDWFKGLINPQPVPTGSTAAEVGQKQGIPRLSTAIIGE